MDYTYFYYSNDFLKSKKLKLGLVLNHLEMRFEVWLLGNTIPNQKKYWELSKATKWNKDKTEMPKYSILETSLVENPDFDNLNALTEQIETKYPYNTFKLTAKEETLVDAKVAPFLQSMVRADFLDLEVLYVGQSYGVEGARTAPDRLKSHSTLQGIYAEAITNNPDSEIYLALASFSQINLMMMDGRTKFSQEELDADTERRNKVNDKLNWEGINEQQKINFTEAALIRYFQPSYNKIYKDSFPNPAHSTYSECYDLDINAVCIELQTSEMINCCMYSDKVKSAPWHMENFLLHSEKDRKSMFEIV